MTISVNGIKINEAAIEKERNKHAHSANPQQAAIEALVLREVLLQTARRTLVEDETGELKAVSENSEIDTESFIEEALIEQLIEKNVAKPRLEDQECERYYQEHPEQFRSADLVEASHILFESVNGQIDDELRQKAQAVLEQVINEPSRFAELAKLHSSCTSAALGGNLGQLSPGETVPEFERVIFSLDEGNIAPELIQTQFGLHIILVAHRAEGRVFPFEMVKDKLAAHLLDQKGKRILRQYLKSLVDKSKIEGMVAG